MPALNFQKQFADKVERREKRQTIRKGDRFKVGDKLYLYTGQRTKYCRKLGEEICREVYEITILNHWDISVDYDILDELEMERLARDDGFKNAKNMFEWFEKTHGFPFNGQLIRW